MVFDKKLLEILACPVCKGKLVLHEETLVCRFDKLSYPIQDSIPVLLESEATSLSSEALEQIKGHS